MTTISHCGGISEQEKEIWERCLSGFQMKKKIDSFILTVKFRGEFECDSPVYHYFYMTEHLTHTRDLDGWEHPRYKWIGRTDDNDPRFPKPYPPIMFNRNGSTKFIDLFFQNIKEKLKPCKQPPPKTIQLLSPLIPVPLEIIWMICSFLRVCEIDWIEKNV